MIKRFSGYTAVLLLACLGGFAFSPVWGFGNYCGDGIADESEECDDGNYDNWDGCSENCRIETDTCGNGIVEDAEACDDGNSRNGDGCSRSCEIDGVSVRDKVADPEPAVVTVSSPTANQSADYYERFVEVIAGHTSACHVGSDGFDFDPVTEFSPGANKKAINLLKTACVINGYKRKGVVGFHGDAPLGVAEALKILTKLYAMRVGEVPVQSITIPYTDIAVGSRYQTYVRDALSQGLLEGITQTELKPLTPIRKEMLQTILKNIDDTVVLDLSGPSVMRNEFVDVVYEIFATELDHYEYVNGRNMVILSRIHGNISQMTPTEQYNFLRKIKTGLAAMDAEMMMDSYLIDTPALVALINEVL